MQKTFGLVRFFPFLDGFFRWAVPRLLDFSSYPYLKGKIAKLEFERNLSYQYIQNKSQMDLYHCKILDILSTENSSYSEMVRLGSPNDGGYVIPSITQIKSPWITIGLGFNTSFENDLILLGTRVDSFDHTIAYRPRNLHKSVKWHKIGFGESNELDLMNLKDIIAKSQIDSEYDWNLKFDIENAEWDLLPEILKLKDDNKLPVIIVSELHQMIWNGSNEFKANLLNELSVEYFPVAVNGNNYSPLFVSANYTIYDAIEVTWLRKDFLNQLNLSHASGDILFTPNDPNSKNFKIGIG